MQSIYTNKRMLGLWCYGVIVTLNHRILWMLLGISLKSLIFVNFKTYYKI